MQSTPWNPAHAKGPDRILEVDFETLKGTHEKLRTELQESNVATARAQEQVASATQSLSGGGRDGARPQEKAGRARRPAVGRRLHEELDRAFSDLRTDLNSTASRAVGAGERIPERAHRRPLHRARVG